jgi:uncharacterized protein YmfQ (DUF2313 family)
VPTLPELYREQFLALLPPGRIWPQHPESSFQQLVLALAQRLAAAHEALLRIFARDLYPRTTVDLIAEWEAACGLPDECTPPPQTLQERQGRVVAVLTVQPNSTLEHLRLVAEALGYPGVLLTETGPYEITVETPNPRWTYFRTGASRCGDLLGSLARAEDLECVLRRQKPAHLSLVFDYSGV